MPSGLHWISGLLSQITTNREACNHGNLFCHSSRAQNLKSRCQRGCAPSRAFQRVLSHHSTVPETLCCLPLSSHRFPSVFVSPAFLPPFLWRHRGLNPGTSQPFLFETGPCCLSLLSGWDNSMHYHPHLCPSQALVLAPGPLGSPGQARLELLPSTSAKTPFPYEGLFTVLGELGYFFLEDTVQPTARCWRGGGGYEGRRNPGWWLLTYCITMNSFMLPDHWCPQMPLKE